MSEIKAIQAQIEEAEKRLLELVDQLREASLVAYIAIFNTKNGEYHIVGVSSEVSTSHRHLSFEWSEDEESVLVKSQHNMTQHVELEETEVFQQENDFLFHVSETQQAAERWSKRKQRKMS
jgi:hypothetical protein